MIPSVEETIRQYVAAWNGKSLEEFKVEFAKCWATEGTYTDPNFALVEGLDGLVALANMSLEKLPVRTFHVVTQPEHHHNSGLYIWSVEVPGRELKEGRDYFEFNEEHKITRLVSFFSAM